MRQPTHTTRERTEVRKVGLRACSALRAQWALAQVVVEKHPELSVARVYRALRRRERAQSTAIGRGAAIPHARVEGIGRAEVVVGVLERAVPYATPDGAPLHTIALVVSDPARPDEHAAAMARAARALCTRDDD